MSCLHRAVVVPIVLDTLLVLFAFLWGKTCYLGQFEKTLENAKVIIK